MRVLPGDPFRGPAEFWRRQIERIEAMRREFQLELNRVRSGCGHAEYIAGSWTVPRCATPGHEHLDVHNIGMRLCTTCGLVERSDTGDYGFRTLQSRVRIIAAVDQRKFEKLEKSFTALDAFLESLDAQRVSIP